MVGGVKKLSRDEVSLYFDSSNVVEYPFQSFVWNIWTIGNFKLGKEYVSSGVFSTASGETWALKFWPKRSWGGVKEWVSAYLCSTSENTVKARFEMVLVSFQLDVIARFALDDVYFVQYSEWGKDKLAEAPRASEVRSIAVRISVVPTDKLSTESMADSALSAFKLTRNTVKLPFLNGVMKSGKFYLMVDDLAIPLNTGRFGAQHAEWITIGLDLGKTTSHELVLSLSTGYVKVTSERALTALAVSAKKHKVPILLEKCLQVLEKNTCMENVTRLVMFARVHEFPTLESSCTDFMAEHFVVLYKTSGFGDLLTHYRDIALEVLAKARSK